MPRYKLTLEYDGTGLVGWQRQDNGPSVQQHLEEAITAFCQEKVDVFGAGRTDAGVHALGQVAHIDLKKAQECRVIQNALNAYLYKENISVLAAEEVDEEFHVRFSAKQRYYLYRILNRQAPPTIRQGKVWHIREDLDLDGMRKGARHLIGNHDFSSFRASECQAKSPIKTLDEITIERDDDEVHITVSAKSFLHNMVRNIVGTLHLVGYRKWQPEDVKAALEAKDRTAAGPTAPAYGLYFLKVEY